MKILFHRIYNLLFGMWHETSSLAREEGCSTLRICFDFMRSYLRAHIQLKEYCECRRSDPDPARRSMVIRKVVDEKIREQKLKKIWLARYYENFRFLCKWSSMKYDASQAATEKRIAAYRRRYNIGEGAWVQYGVTIISEHFSDANIRIGKNCLLSRGCDLDFTGGITAGDGVCILEGAKILTHAHDSLHMKKDDVLIPYSNRAYKTPLEIGDGVEICSRAVILPGVRKIGSNSMIAAGAVVSREVPPNSVVAGNPAKVVFSLEPDMKIDTGH